jgi:hypothetical protein
LSFSRFGDPAEQQQADDGQHSQSDFVSNAHHDGLLLILRQRKVPSGQRLPDNAGPAAKRRSRLDCTPRRLPSNQKQLFEFLMKVCS